MAMRGIARFVRERNARCLLSQLEGKNNPRRNFLERHLPLSRSLHSSSSSSFFSIPRSSTLSRFGPCKCTPWASASSIGLTLTGGFYKFSFSILLSMHVILVLFELIML